MTMPTLTLQQVRDALLEQERAKQPQTKKPKSTSDNASFPFWMAADGTTSTVRFLPDGNPDNGLFWAARETIRLPFAGQVGGEYPTQDQVVVTVPCVDMFVGSGLKCPIIAETKPWWRQGGEKEALARQYYKKKSYLFQGFVVNSPFDEDAEAMPPDGNPIRRFVINPSIHEIIKNSLMDAEMESMPIDYREGRDFKISKTKKGEYSNYGTSTWSLRSRALNQEEMAAIEKFGLFNLKTFLGPVPDQDGIRMILAMFHDSLARRPFDFDAYGAVYKAYGTYKAGGQSDEGAVVDQAASTSVKPATQSSSDILNRIRSRKSA